MKPKRPELLKFSSLSELYRHFETLFLSGNSSSYECVSACGHTMKVFDHHFFHMVKLGHPDKPKLLLMANEKDTILAMGRKRENVRGRRVIGRPRPDLSCSRVRATGVV